MFESHPIQSAVRETRKDLLPNRPKPVPVWARTNPAVPATIFVDGIPRNDWGMWQTFEPGTYKISYGPVAGYVAPPARDGDNH